MHVCYTTLVLYSAVPESDQSLRFLCAFLNGVRSHDVYNVMSPRLLFLLYKSANQLIEAVPTRCVCVPVSISK